VVYGGRYVNIDAYIPHIYGGNMYVGPRALMSIYAGGW